MNIWDHALGFMHAQMLLTAEELGVFDALDEAPRTAETLAEAVEMPVDSARRLLTGLSALELVERDAEGHFVNSAEASAQLVSGKPGYIGDMFDHVREVLYPAWGNLREVLLENESVPDGPPDRRAPEEGEAPSADVYRDEQSLRSFMEGMHAITYESGQKFAANAPELQEVEHIVDVGGASGAFLIALAEAHSRLEGTVLDLPEVRPIAEEHIQEQDLADRLSFEARDFFNDPLPEGRDAYSLGYILHDWDEAAGSLLLEKISKAIRPGGLLIIGESLLDEDRGGPLYVARNDLNMMVAAQGRERTLSEYEDWIGTYGFELERVHPTEEKDFLVARRNGK